MRYKLTPVAGRLDDPAWGRSATRATIYVGARNEGEARETAARKLAARKLMGAAADESSVKASGTGPDDAAPGRNPWLDPRVTDCIEVNDIAGDSMLLGEVIAAE